MIYVRVELWPGGDESRRQLIGSALIANDGTGTPTRGNYLAKFCGKRDRLLRHVALRSFPRKRKNVWYLLRYLLNAAFEDAAK